MLLVKWLKHNLLSVSQLCDKWYFVVFDTLRCLIENKASTDLVFKGSRIDNIYMLDSDYVSMHGSKRLVTKSEDYWVWNRRLSYVHFDLINKIVSKNLVIGLPKIKFSKD